MLKFLNKFKLVFLGVLYIVYLIHAYSTNDSKELDKLVKSPSVLFSIIFTLIVLINIIYDYYFPFTKITQDRIISDINEKVSFKNIPFIIRILNDDLIYSSDSGLNEKIIDADIWDWTIISNHVDTKSNISFKLIESIKESHFKNKKEIQTSSLIYLDDYPYYRENIYILGNILAPSSEGNPEDFPILLPPKTQITFTSYYEYKSYIKENKHLIKEAKFTEKQSLIKKKYSQIYNKYLEHSEVKQILCWKDSPPNENDINLFLEKLKINKDDSHIVLERNIDFWTTLKVLRAELNWFFVLLFIIGYLLSPISFYNDLFVNVPLSYFLADRLHILIPLNYHFSFLVFYILTNVLGILIMKFSLIEVKKKVDWLYTSNNTYKTILIISILLLGVSYFIESFLFK